MNSPASTLRGLLRASVAATLLALAACSPPEEPPLQGATIGGPFTLTQAVSDADFNGRYRIVYFGYSFCPDICPVDLNSLMLGLKQFERQDAAKAANIQPIFITVDPERDTPEVLARFVRNFHPKLVGLSGSPEQIAAVAAKYAVSYRREASDNEESYLVSHKQLAFLMGPDGKPLALLPLDNIATEGVNEGTPDLVAAELARWVR